MLEMVVCAPEFFDVTYAINPWMDIHRKVDHSQATAQWRNLLETLISLGAFVHIVPAEPGLPDMVFAGDAGIVFGDRFVASNFKHAERRRETTQYKAWFEEQGRFEIVELPKNVVFEGLGDVVFDGSSAVMAFGQRTSKDGLLHLRTALPNMNVLATVELVDPRF